MSAVPWPVLPGIWPLPATGLPPLRAAFLMFLQPLRPTAARAFSTWFPGPDAISPIHFTQSSLQSSYSTLIGSLSPHCYGSTTRAGPLCTLPCLQRQVGPHSRTGLVVSEGAAGRGTTPQSLSYSLVCLVCWAGPSPSGHPLLLLGGKLPWACCASLPSPGTHFDLDLLLHLLTLHSCVLLLEPAEEKADVVTVSPSGAPFPPAPWLLGTDLFIFLGLYLTW